jgi:hypothetical protein
MAERDLSLLLLVMQVEALKLLSIKLLNTATLVYQLYRIQTNMSGPTIDSIKSSVLQVIASQNIRSESNRTGMESLIWNVSLTTLCSSVK